MFNLLYKEFKLSIHPFYLVLPVIIGALVFIPQWVFFLVPLYFCFITVPNMFGMYKAYNDLSFSVMLPVRKQDIVAARVLSIVILELYQIAWMLVFTLVRHAIYKPGNFAFDLNIAYFGLVLAMYGIYNLILFPMFYRTAYKFGAAVITATVTAILFAAGAEMLVMLSTSFRTYMEIRAAGQLVTLISGIAVFVVTGYIAFVLSAKQFEKVDV